MPSLTWWVIYGSLVLAFVLMGYRANQVGRAGLGQRMGPVNWDFSESWASTFTVIGAFLGTVLGESDVIPETTHYLPNAAYSGLNLLFGLVALLAPLVYTAVRTVKYPHGKTGVKEPQYQGFVWAFLLASALTLWAVLGELVTVGLLLAEMREAGALPSSTIFVLASLGGISLILVCVYVVRGTYWVIAYQTDKPGHKKKLQAHPGFRRDESDADDIEAPLPSWSVF